MGSDLPWLRWYNGTRHNKKFRALTPEGRCLWVALLELASELGLRGVVHFVPGVKLTDEQLADEAKVSTRSVQPTLEALKRYGWVEEQEECLFLPKFAERQYMSDLSTSRVRKHRDKKRSGNGGETVDETFHQRFGNGVETPPDNRVQSTDTDKNPNDDKRAEWRRLEAWMKAELPKAYTAWGMDTKWVPFLNAMGADAVRMAITEAAAQGVAEKPSYALTVLANWQSKGVQSVEDAQRLKQEHEAGKATKPDRGRQTGRGSPKSNVILRGDRKRDQEDWQYVFDEKKFGEPSGE